jgi:hypothetical protein
LQNNSDLFREEKMIAENEIKEIKKTIIKLERQNRRLNWGFYTLLFLLTATVSASVFIGSTNAGSTVQQDSVLRVRGLIIVDEKGRERVQIGAPLPDPLLQGKRYKRSGAVSGILLMDAEGNERSGYFTSDEPGTVALTLDTVQGQTAMFLANDEKGANLQIFDRDNGHSVRLLAVGDSSNFIVTRQGKRIFQLPEAKEEKK